MQENFCTKHFFLSCSMNLALQNFFECLHMKTTWKNTWVKKSQTPESYMRVEFTLAVTVAKSLEYKQLTNITCSLNMPWEQKRTKKTSVILVREYFVHHQNWKSTKKKFTARRNTCAATAAWAFIGRQLFIIQSISRECSIL